MLLKRQRMRLSPWCRDRVTGKEDGKSGRGCHWLPVQNTKYGEIVPDQKKRWQSCSNQCDEFSGEDGRGWREKDYGASNCGRISAHKQQTSVYPDNLTQDQATAGQAHKRSAANTCAGKYSE